MQHCMRCSHAHSILLIRGFIHNEKKVKIYKRRVETNSSSENAPQLQSTQMTRTAPSTEAYRAHVHLEA